MDDPRGEGSPFSFDESSCSDSINFNIEESQAGLVRGILEANPKMYS
jgi:hypothetical protein